jgi:uncharacterized protein (DUF1697 family)
MKRLHLALLRGINLGGKNRLPMKELAEIFAKAGCGNVATYIQSGNVIFSAPDALLKKLPQIITGEITTRFGYQIPVIVRTSEEMAQIIRDNPFLQAGKPEQTLHVYFLADVPSAPAIKNLDPHRSAPDAFCVRNREVYLQLPNGMARTKLTNAYFDSKLSTTSTARKWATVLKLYEMLPA